MYEVSPPKLINLVLFLLPIPLFSIKSATGVLFFLLSILVAFQIGRNPRHYFSCRSRLFWFLLFVISFPFFAQLVAQIGQGQIIPRGLDGPFRFLLAGVIFVYFSRDLRETYYLSLIKGSFWCLICTSTVLILGAVMNPDLFLFKWTGRLAPYFGDPITFAICFGALALFAIENVDKVVYSKGLRIFVVTVSIALVVYVMGKTGSRTAWIASLASLELMLIMRFLKRDVKTFILLNSIIILVLVIGLICSNFFLDRLSLIFEDIRLMREGNTNTSIGLRWELIFIDFELIRLYPFFGLRDGVLPAFDSLRAGLPDLSSEAYRIRLLAGSHSEMTVKLVRNGLPLGLLCIFCLFVLPLIYSFRIFRFGRHENNNWSFSFLSFVVVFVVGSLGVQTLNLKMLSTIFGLFIALFYALVLHESGEETSDSPSDLSGRDYV